VTAADRPGPEPATTPAGPPAPTIAVLGLGEAGAAFASDLVTAGARVRGYDPVAPAPPGVEVHDDEASATRGADLVLSVNSASAALDALSAGAGAMPAGAVWADLNTGSPGLKTELDLQARAAGRVFADVAIMAPVPGLGLQVPFLASGEGAGRVRAVLTPLGAEVRLQPGPPGEAARRKLLRSVFFKGLAAAVVEALEAAEAAGCSDWLSGNIADELEGAGPQTVRRLVEGSHTHAGRRADEMSAATRMLEELGVEPLVAAASRDLLVRLRDRPRTA